MAKYRIRIVVRLTPIGVKDLDKGRLLADVL